MTKVSVIVPMDNAGCAEGIAALLRDQNLMKMLSENCRRGGLFECLSGRKADGIDE